jgi:hypothetical protein
MEGALPHRQLAEGIGAHGVSDLEAVSFPRELRSRVRESASWFFPIFARNDVKR